MDIASAFNAPRMVQLGGETYFVPALLAEDYAVLAAWLDDVIPGKETRVIPPAMSDPQCQEALDSIDGWILLVWISLRHQGATYSQAQEIAEKATDDERYYFRKAVYARRRTIKVLGHGEDIGSGWWGPLISSLGEHRKLSPIEIGKFSLDQIELLAEEGCPSEHPGMLTLDQVQAMWEASQKNGAATS